MKKLKLHFQFLTGLFRFRKQYIELWNAVKSKQYKASLKTYVYLILGLLYVVFPFDLIADLIPVVGWIDDGVVVSFVAKQLNEERLRYLSQKWVLNK